MKFFLLLMPFLLIGSTAEARDPNLIGARVKSGSWRIIRKGDRIEIFEKDVRYIKPNRVLRADWAKFDHGTGIFEAKGNVRGRQRFKGGVWAELLGHSASHNKNTGEGVLRPEKKDDRVTFRLTGPGETGRGSARLLRWNQLRETVLLEGDFGLVEERGSAQAERAEYIHGDKTLTMIGRRPVMTGRDRDWASAVQADVIAATDLGNGKRRVTAKGRAQGWIFFDGTDRRSYH